MFGGAITRQCYFFRIDKLGDFHLSILAKINQHRAGAATAGNMKRLPHHLSNFIRTCDQIVMLGDRQRDTGYIRLLKGIAADQTSSDAGDEIHRLTERHMAETGEVNYRKAMHRVLSQNPDLKRVYGS